MLYLIFDSEENITARNLEIGDSQGYNGPWFSFSNPKPNIWLLHIPETSTYLLTSLENSNLVSLDYLNSINCFENLSL